MKFFSLPGGITINLESIAYFMADPMPRLPELGKEKAVGGETGIKIVFPGIAIKELGGEENLSLILKGEDAARFLNAVAGAGADVETIRKATGIKKASERKG